MMTAISVSAARHTSQSSTRRIFGGLQRYSTSTLTIAPWRKAVGMPMKTIQIRLTRIRISDHSAGCSSTKRVTIWNTPSAEAITSMRQATAMDSELVHWSNRRKADFMSEACRDQQKKSAREPVLRGRAPRVIAARSSLEIADLFDVGLRSEE